MCKFESGLTSKKCKLFLGRVILDESKYQAHLQLTQADTQPKVAKELNTANAFLPTLKTNFFGNGSALIERIMDFIKIDN